MSISMCVQSTSKTSTDLLISGRARSSAVSGERSCAVNSKVFPPNERGSCRPTTRPLLVRIREPFETGRVFTPRVDRYSQITVRTNRYSVPVQLIGKQVRVMLHASHLVVYDKNVEVARHERLIAKDGCRLELDHYLEALVRKPGALPGATALEQARSAGKFTPVHDAWWQAAVKAHGDAEGTRALIEVLLLGRHIAHEHLVTGLATALRAGALTADAVALEARKATQAEDEPPALDSPAQSVGQPSGTVTFLHEWRLAHLPTDTRPLPSVSPYDQLLRRRRVSGGGHREGEAQ
ncbi:Mu transposase domain-containing protein [Streptomyces platensis]|uniref:Mu transposase domain-containing protein n=1 Tax=Streptomyces platensis TaxID=58346 RepID=UPI00378D17E2